jgi:hypothetical protein
MRALARLMTDADVQLAATVAEAGSESLSIVS